MTTLHTPLYGLPYPDGSERVMDGDNAIGALALAIETLVSQQRVQPPLYVNATPVPFVVNSVSPTYAIIPGTTITYTSTQPERVWVVATYDVNQIATGSGNVRGTIHRGGVAQIGMVANLPAVPTRGAHAVEYSIDLTNGTTTFDLRVLKDSAGGTANIESARMVVLRTPVVLARDGTLRDLLGNKLEPLPAPELEPDYVFGAAPKRGRK